MIGNDFKPLYLSNTQINKQVESVSNSSNFNHYVERFVENILSIFEWKNLPEEIPEYVLEKYLMVFGMMCMYRTTEEYEATDETGIPVLVEKEILKVAPFTIQFYNDYWEPTVVQTVNIVSPSLTLFEDEFEYCFNNKSGYPTINNIYWFADILGEIETTISITTQQLRQPYIFEGSPQLKKSYDDLFNKIKKGQVNYFVVSEKFFSDGKSEKHDLLGTGAEKRLDSSYMLKEKYLQEWNNIIGVHSNINNKNERLTENESVGYNEIGNINIAGMLQMRKEFCKRANRMFGLNMDVEYSSIVREKLKEQEDVNEVEVEEDVDN